MLAVHLGLYLWLLVLGVSTQCKQSIPGMTLCHKEAEISRVNHLCFAQRTSTDYSISIMFPRSGRCKHAGLNGRPPACLVPQHLGRNPNGVYSTPPLTFFLGGGIPLPSIPSHLSSLPSLLFPLEVGPFPSSPPLRSSPHCGYAVRGGERILQRLWEERGRQTYFGVF